MPIETQQFDYFNSDVELPGIGQLRQIASEHCPLGEDQPGLQLIEDNDLNLNSVYESFDRIAGIGGFQGTAGHAPNFDPGKFSGGLPVGDELKSLLNKNHNNNLQSAAEQGFASSTFSDYSFGRDQQLTYNTRDTFDILSIRKDFPILQQKVNGKDLIWFDNAATTQKPHSVINEIARFYEQDNSNIHRAAHTLAARSSDAYEKAREKVKNFIGASSTEEIIFVRGTTEGINLVAQTFGRKFIQPGDEIIISTLDHPDQRQW